MIISVFGHAKPQRALGAMISITGIQAEPVRIAPPEGHLGVEGSKMAEAASPRTYPRVLDCLQDDNMNRQDPNYAVQRLNEDAS